MSYRYRTIAEHCGVKTLSAIQHPSPILSRSTVNPYRAHQNGIESATRVTTPDALPTNYVYDKKHPTRL